jgi:PAS domain S-box-containing protein
MDKKQYFLYAWLLASMVVVLVGITSLMGYWFDIPLLKTYTLIPYKEISLAASVSFLLLGGGMLLLSDDSLLQKRVFNRLASLLLLIPMGIAVYTLFSYFYLAHFQIFKPFVQNYPQIDLTFLSAIQLLLASTAMLALQRKQQTWWGGINGSALVGLFILESTIFAFVGQWARIPVLFSFEQALPTSIAFMAISIALLQTNAQSGGILYPLLSSSPRIRVFSFLGILSGFLILLAGTITINLFQRHLPETLFISELIVGFEFSTIALSILVTTLTLKLSYFVENSLQAENLIKISETRFRLLVSAVQDYAIYMLNPDGEITTWNEGAEKIYGYSPTEITGKNFEVLYPDHEKALGLPQTQLESSKQGESLEFDNWQIRQDGSRFWGKNTITALFNPEGVLLGYSNVIRDLTLQKNLEDSLRASIFELSNFKQAIDAASIVSTTDNKGIITSVNQAFCDISLYTQAEIIGKTHRLVNSGYHPAAYFQEVWQTIEQGKIWKGEFKNRAKNGTFYWVDTTIYPFLDENKVPIRYIAIHHDITLRKLAQENLKAQAYRQKILSSLSRQALSGIDIDPLLERTVTLVAHGLQVPLCKVLTLQSSGQDFLLQAGFGWHEGLVKNTLIPTGTDSQAGFALLMEEPVIVEDLRCETRFNESNLLKNHQVVSGVSVIIKGEVPEKPYGVIGVHTTTPHHFETEEVAFLQAISNIIAIAVERKRAENMLHQFNEALEARVSERTQALAASKGQAEEANRLKSEVLAFVAHDFKNPLAAMDRFIQILKQQTRTMSSEQRQMLNYVSEGISQLRAMVTDILDKARMEAGQLVLNLEWITLQSLLEGLEPIMAVLADEKGVKLEYEIQPNLPGIEADPRFLRQIILNLVSNAIKYNHTGGHVWLKIQEASTPHFVSIEVQDNGIGIPADKLSQIFDPYFRSGTASYDNVEGTGLGLAYAKKLIDLHGGEIHVTSEVGVGSTFVVLLPSVLPFSLPATLEQSNAPGALRE